LLLSYFSAGIIFSMTELLCFFVSILLAATAVGMIAGLDRLK
jgi:hypothetical protein